MNLALFILTSAALLIGNELFKRKFLVPTYISRKIAHIGSGLIAFISPLFLSREELIFICVVFVVALFLARGRNFLSSIHAVQRKTWGEVYLPLGVALCALFFLPQETRAFQFGVLIMGISDGLAGVVGEGFGKHYFKLAENRKSVEGTGTFFLVSIVLALLFIQEFDYRILGIALILTVVEFFLLLGLDNLVLPILAASLIQFL